MTELQQAFIDWRTNRAYIDGNGNYHVRKEGRKTGRGPIAKWNRAVKRQFSNVTDFHNKAMEMIL